MYNEELTEEGIVKESENGIATIVIASSDNCEECTAKLYCKPGNSKERSLVVKDSFGVKKGDSVKVMIKGSKLISASLLIYGVPLFILLLGLIIGMKFINSHREIFSTLISVCLVALYLTLFRLISKKKNSITKHYPEIIFVNSKSDQN